MYRVIQNLLHLFLYLLDNCLINFAVRYLKYMNNEYDEITGPAQKKQMQSFLLALQIFSFNTMDNEKQSQYGFQLISNGYITSFLQPFAPNYTVVGKSGFIQIDPI